MGAGSSREDDKYGSNVEFKAPLPVHFSDQLQKSLQESAETDSTRAKNLELMIQSRVTEELEKRLKATESSLSSASEAASSEETKSSGPSWTEKPLVNRIAEALTGKSDENNEKELDRNVVSKEIEELRKKLENRKKTVEQDKGVEAAKDKVVTCLRTNDRRPLDCWREVEDFKKEVARLERKFIEKNGF